MTGREYITATPKYGHPVTFLPEWALWLTTNSLPKIEHGDSATWDRLFMVEVCKPKAHDRDLKAKLHTPQALARWLQVAAAGLRDYQEHGLHVPPAVVAWRSAARAEANPVAHWIEHSGDYVLDPNGTADAGAMRAAYVQHCKDAGERPADWPAYYAGLAAFGIKRERTKYGKHLRGIRPRAADERRGRDGV